VPDGAPKRDDGLAVEPPGLAGQLIQLFTCADMHSAYLIGAHRRVFFCSAPKAVKCLTRDARVKAALRLTAAVKTARLAAG
jgi:hypothetical protein